MLQLTTALTQNGDVWTLKPRAEAQTSFCDSKWLIDILKELSEVEINALIIDLASIKMLDSVGVDLLLDIQKNFAQRNTKVVLQNLNINLRAALRVMQLDHAFEINSSPPVAGE
jgi:anti-anti-sigma factor